VGPRAIHVVAAAKAGAEEGAHKMVTACQVLTE
jgi:hypothetical protein